MLISRLECAYVHTAMYMYMYVHISLYMYISRIYFICIKRERDMRLCTYIYTLSTDKFNKYLLF